MTPDLLADRYELVKELGRGAMGVVHLAHDRILDNTDVAVKILPKELETDPRALTRLKREAMTAMKITHPNVMRLINFEESNGARFLVMEYIDGPDLLHVLADAPGGKLDVDTFLRYADGICTGVDYAHQQNVVHSDLKPSNIMLNSNGDVKITDFGVAQVVRESMTRVSRVETAGTLLYMSPEILGGAHNTALSDQYALGITFYEMLTGDPPFVRGDITKQHETKPVPPIPDVPEHINDAILKALAKKPEERWPDVETFGDALRGELSNDWNERQTILRPRQQVDDWREDETVVRSSATGTGRLFITSEPTEATVFVDGRQVGTSGSLISDVPSGERKVRLSFPDYDDLTETVTIEPNRITRLDGLVMEEEKATVNIISDPPDAAITFDGKDAGRTPQTIDKVAAGKYPLTLIKPEYVEIHEDVEVVAPVTDLEYDLEGGAVEFGGKWVSEAERDRKQAEEQRSRKITLLKQQIRTAFADRAWDDAEKLNNELKLFDIEEKSHYTERIEQGRKADQRRAAEEERRRKLREEQAAEQERQRELARKRRPWIIAAAAVVVCVIAVIWWSNYDPHTTLTGHSSTVLSVPVTGDRIVSGSVDHTIKVWDLNSGRLIRTLRGHSSSVYSVVVAGNRIVSGSQNGRIKVWDLNSGRLIRTLTGHSSYIRSVAVAGDRIVSGSEDHTIKVWNLNSGQLIRTLTGHSRSVYSVAVSGNRIVSGSRDNTIKVWDLNSGQLIRTLTGHSNYVHSVSVAGNRIVSGSGDNTIKVWDLNSGQLIRTLTGHSNPVRSVAVAGDRIVSGSEDGTIKVWDLNSGQLIRTLTGHSDWVYSVAVAGNRIVSGSRDGTIKIWRAPWE